jgi:hypothetical protein
VPLAVNVTVALFCAAVATTGVTVTPIGKLPTLTLTSPFTPLRMRFTVSIADCPRTTRTRWVVVANMPIAIPPDEADELEVDELEVVPELVLLEVELVDDMFTFVCAVSPTHATMSAATKGRAREATNRLICTLSYQTGKLGALHLFG